MKARLAAAPPSGEWNYEIKFDGYRALARKECGEVRLLSRNQKDLARKFPEIAEALAALPATEAVADGEIVALDAEGRSRFQLLQQVETGRTRPALFYYLFDLLRLDGRDLLDEPLETRRAKLEKLLRNAPEALRFSGALGGDARDLLRRIRRLGLEGLIGKRKGSKYEPGRRSGAWIKLRVGQEQEMVIGGYTEPAGGRQRFGALLVGYQEKGRLKFAGKVGTGFDEASLEALFARFQKIRSERCPFTGIEAGKGGEEGLSRAERKRCHWIKPELVCQVKFSEWTSAGKLRQPVFLGLREDKEAAEVVRETTA